MDSYYLNNGVEKLNEFLIKADNPKFTGEVVFERRAPHCWGPRGAELMTKMIAHIEKYAPAGAELKGWGTDGECPPYSLNDTAGSTRAALSAGT